jgi:hypothetical protein
MTTEALGCSTSHEWVPGGDEHQMVLPDGRVVLYVPLYKHLGTPTMFTVHAHVQCLHTNASLQRECRSVEIDHLFMKKEKKKKSSSFFGQ